MSPIKELIKELLPAPTSPIIATNSPHLTFKFMDFKVIKSSKVATLFSAL